MRRAFLSLAVIFFVTGTAYAQMMPPAGEPTPAPNPPEIHPPGDGPPDPPDDDEIVDPSAPTPTNPAPLLPLPGLPEELPPDPPDCEAVRDTCGDAFAFDIEKVKHNAPFKAIHVSKREVAPGETWTCTKETASGRALVSGKISMVAIKSEESGLWSFQKIKTVTVKSCTHTLYQATSRESVGTKRAKWTLPAYSRAGYLDSPAYSYGLSIRKFDTTPPPGAPQLPTKDVSIGYALNVTESMLLDKTIWDYMVRIENTGSLADVAAERHESWSNRVSLALLVSGKICPDWDLGKVDNSVASSLKAGSVILDVLAYNRMTEFDPLECEAFGDDLTVAKNTIESLVADSSRARLTWAPKGDTNAVEAMDYAGIQTPPWTETSNYSYTVNGVLQARTMTVEGVRSALYARDRLIPPVPLVPGGSRMDTFFRYPLLIEVS